MRQRIQDIRRRELIEATRAVIEERGFEHLTVADIARKAGFSNGYLHHHFRSKNDLLAETMRVLYADMRSFIATNMSADMDARNRLAVIIDANFREEQFTRENASIWISYLARVRFERDFQRLQAIIQRRLRSNLLHDLNRLASQHVAEEACSELSALIDGLWVRLAVDPDGFTSRAAKEVVNRRLSKILEHAAMT